MPPFSLKESRKANPSKFPSGAPMERNTRLQGIFTSHYISFYLSLRVPGKAAPFLLPKMVPMGSDTPSQSHWS